MKKKIVIGLLFCFVLMITGCGNKDANDTALEENLPQEVTIESGKKVAFSDGSGIYAEQFDLTLTFEEEAVIYYTTDGSDPAVSDTRIEYEGSISIADRSNDENVLSAVDPALFDAAYATLNAEKDDYGSSVSAPSNEEVDKCTVIKAVAKLQNGGYSETVTNTYFIGTMEEHIQGIKESCEAAGQTLAVISISMDFDDLFDQNYGIYVKGNIFRQEIWDYLENYDKLEYGDARSFDANYKQRGREWERKAHIEFLESDGTNTSCVLQQDCGIRIQGNFSRSDLQKGFRLYARKEYGDNNFNYPVFGEDYLNDAGEVMNQFKTLILRNGGNCAFTTKYSDAYWQSLVEELDCETQKTRPCIVYLNGEYWGLYVLEEDYSQDYFEDVHGVDKSEVVLYKGDAEKYDIGFKLDLGDLPEGVTDETYYYSDLIDFFYSHSNLESAEDFEEFSKLVDPQSVLDYFATEIWINNKWDWPGKNWSMWRTLSVDESNSYADGRWRFCFYDMEFGGVSGSSDATTNTIKEDNYRPDGMLDYDTTNPAVLCFVYCMSNADFRAQYIAKLQSLSVEEFEYSAAIERLNYFKNVYTPLYDQFFARFDDVGSTENSNNGGYASAKCIADFLEKRASYIPKMIQYIKDFYGES